MIDDLLNIVSKQEAALQYQNELLKIHNNQIEKLENEVELLTIKINTVVDSLHR